MQSGISTVLVGRLLPGGCGAGRRGGQPVVLTARWVGVSASSRTRCCAVRVTCSGRERQRGEGGFCFGGEPVVQGAGRVEIGERALAGEPVEVGGDVVSGGVCTVEGGGQCWPVRVAGEALVGAVGEVAPPLGRCWRLWWGPQRSGWPMNPTTWPWWWMGNTSRLRNRSRSLPLRAWVARRRRAAPRCWRRPAGGGPGGRSSRWGRTRRGTAGRRAGRYRAGPGGTGRPRSRGSGR